MKVYVISDFEGEWFVESKKPDYWQEDEVSDSYTYNSFEVPRWRYYSYKLSYWLRGLTYKIDYFPWHIVHQRHISFRKNLEEKLKKDRLKRETIYRQEYNT